MNDDEDFDQDDDIVSAHESVWEHEQSVTMVSWTFFNMYGSLIYYLKCPYAL